MLPPLTTRPSKFKLTLGRLLYTFGKRTYGFFHVPLLKVTTFFGRTGLAMILQHGGEEALLTTVNDSIRKYGMELVGPTQLRDEAMDRLARAAASDPETTRYSN